MGLVSSVGHLGYSPLSRRSPRLWISLGFNIAKALLTAAGGNLPRQLSSVQISSRSPNKVQAALKTTQDLDHTRLLPPYPVDVTDPKSLDTAFKDADVVVSLVGLLRGTPEQFERTQWIGAENVANTAAGVGAKLIHFSAMGANVDSTIPYWRTKALGERAIFSRCPGATVFRPSIVFGPGDGFFTVSSVSVVEDCGFHPKAQKLVGLASILPFMPVFGGGTTRFQPIFVGDLAHAVKAIVEIPEVRGRVAGKIIEAGGPDSQSIIHLTFVSRLTLARSTHLQGNRRLGATSHAPAAPHHIYPLQCRHVARCNPRMFTRQHFHHNS